MKTFYGNWTCINTYFLDKCGVSFYIGCIKNVPIQLSYVETLTKEGKVKFYRSKIGILSGGIREITNGRRSDQTTGAPLCTKHDSGLVCCGWGTGGII